MHKNIAQTLKLYDKNPSSADVSAVFDDADLASLTHTTTLPGGFGELALTVASSEGEFWDWRRNRMLSRMTLEEAGGRVIWEGRVEAVELSEIWRASLTARGYWSNLNDAVLNRSYSNGVNTARAIIADLLGRIPSGQLQLSSSAERVAAGPAIAHDYQDDWTVWRILTDSGRGIASFGSGAPGAGEIMDVAVWEDRKLSYAPRTASGSGVVWRSYLRTENGGGVVRLPLRYDWNDVANAVSATYERDGKLRRAPTASDAASIARHIRRQRNVPNIGETTDATAILRRDAELNRRSRLRPNLGAAGQNAPAIALNRVWDANGIEWPLCRVRAGDILRIPDIEGGDADGYGAFFVESTRCDHAAGTLAVAAG